MGIHVCVRLDWLPLISWRFGRNDAHAIIERVPVYVDTKMNHTEKMSPTRVTRNRGNFFELISRQSPRTRTITLMEPSALSCKDFYYFFHLLIFLFTHSLICLPFHSFMYSNVLQWVILFFWFTLSINLNNYMIWKKGNLPYFINWNPKCSIVEYHHKASPMKI